MLKLYSKSYLFYNNYHPLLLPTLFSRFSTIINPHEDFSINPQLNPNPNPNPNFAVKSNRAKFAILDKDPEKIRTHDDNFDEFGRDVEKIYQILRKFHSRVPKLELALQESGVVVRSGLTERVINRCGDAGNLGYRFYVWASRQPGYCHSSQVYKTMIKTLGKMRQFGTVWAIIEEMWRENPDMITSDVFIVLMRRFASAKMVKRAIDVLDEMPKYGCEPDEYVFGCLLDTFCKNGSVKEAALLFEDMRVKFPPNIKHFTSLLYGWCKEGKLIEAKFVLIQMRQAGFVPDIAVYNNLLNGYAEAGKMGDAYDLLKEMRRKGCEPNAASYTILIHVLCKKNRSDEAMRVFFEMDENGCDADVMTYNALVNGMCKCRNIVKAYDLVDIMIERGHTPDEATFLPILIAHERKEQLEECLELVERMKKFNCFLDTKIYNTLIRLTFKLGEVKEGMRLWNEMEASHVSVGRDSFVIMIHGLVAQSCLVEACNFFKEMANRGLITVPVYGILKDLLNTLLRAEKLELAKGVWDCLVSSGCDMHVCAWTIWVHALFEKGYEKEACDYCLKMIDADFMLQHNTFAKLIPAVNRLYDRELSVKITQKVRRMCADRYVSFKMYKRRGEKSLEEIAETNIRKTQMKRGKNRKPARPRLIKWTLGDKVNANGHMSFSPTHYRKEFGPKATTAY